MDESTIPNGRTLEGYEDYKAGRLVPCLLPEPSLFQQAAATYQMGIVPASIIGRLLPQL